MFIINDSYLFERLFVNYLKHSYKTQAKIN